jgi:hypothetical protein
MVTLVKLVQYANAPPARKRLPPMPTTGMPYMAVGITTFPPVPVYLVIVIVPSDTV